MPTRSLIVEIKPRATKGKKKKKALEHETS
jgi:hypothetical protein